jgi:hypothetical protein
LPQRRSSSRRSSKRGSRLVCFAEGVSSPPARHTLMTIGCSTRFKEGSHLSPFAGTACERGRSVLFFSLVGPHDVHRHRLNHPRRNRRWNSRFASHAAREERWPSTLHSQAVLRGREKGGVGAVWLAACLFFERRRGKRMPCLPNKQTWEARAFVAARVETPSRWCIGENRSLVLGGARASFQS